MSPPTRRLNAPRRVAVIAGADGRPVAVGAHGVEAVRESWLIEDRWWTDRPLRRRYWELVTEAGANTIVFRDLRSGGWYRQR
jgi:CO dehydrogenase/acetyl-CoA synthase delta subunit